MTAQQTLYLVDRASDCKGEIPPCDGAYKIPITHTNTAPTIFASGGGLWYHHWLSVGTNHRQVGETLIRDYTCDEWVVEIENIQDFVKQNGDCVIRWKEHYSMLKITIYDDYIE